MQHFEISITDWAAGTWTLPDGWTASKASDDLVLTHGLALKPLDYAVFSYPSDYPTSQGVSRAESSITTLFVNSDNQIQVRKLGLLDGNTIYVHLFFPDSV